MQFPGHWQLQAAAVRRKITGLVQLRMAFSGENWQPIESMKAEGRRGERAAQRRLVRCCSADQIGLP